MKCPLVLIVGLAACGSGAAARDATPVVDADPTLTANEQQLVDLPADSWLHVPNGFGAVCDDTFNADWHAVSGCAGIFAWSGGAWDSDHRQFLLFGGGHNDYAGNEVYAFDARTFAWSRLTAPSPKPYDRDPLDDGKPASRHTYDGLTWINETQTMMVIGGSRSNDGGGTNVTWMFDPASKAWTNKAPATAGPGGYDMSTVYDPLHHKVWAKAGEKLHAYDIAQNTWSQVSDLGYPPLWPRYSGGHLRGTWDTKRGLVWMLGGSQYIAFDAATSMFVTDAWVTTGGATFTNQDAVPGHPEEVITTGGGEVIKADAPGVDYDAKADALVAWIGGAPWVLNLATKTWQQRSAANGPATPFSTGTYGRWRYLAKYNVFMLVNDKDGVWFYKNTAGG